MIKLVKVGVKKLLMPKEALDLFDETYVAIQKWDEQSINIRRCFYGLIRGDAFVELKKFDSEKELFKELCNLSTLHRSTLYDYKNAALIEVELCLEHGRISVNALLELKKDTTEESRKEIWLVVENMCRFDEKNPTPTKAIIAQAKKYYHHNNTTEGKAEREAYFNDQDDELTYICDEYDDQNRQMTAEKALICIKNYTSKELELLSKRIFPTSKVGKDAYKILRETTADELDKFKAELRALCEKSDDEAREYSSPEMFFPMSTLPELVWDGSPEMFFPMSTLPGLV